jgi:hypothetical protein
VSEQPAHPAAAAAAAVSTPPPTLRPPTQKPLDYARPLFVENQQFTQWYVWAMLLLPAAVAIALIGFFLSRLSLWSRQLHVLLPAMALPLAMPALFFVLRMNVVMTGQRLIVRFFPIRRRIELSEMASFRAITYTIKDFGGWGIKWARDRSLVLNVSGNRAIRINRRTGKSLILGTQRPDEFAAALEELGVPREPD